MYSFYVSKWSRTLIARKSRLMGLQLTLDTSCHVCKCFQSLRFSSSYYSKSSVSDTKEWEGLDNDLKKRIFNTVLWDSDVEANPWKRRIKELSENQLRRRENILKGEDIPRPSILKLLESPVDTDGSLNEPLHTEASPPVYPYAEVTKEVNKFKDSKRNDKATPGRLSRRLKMEQNARIKRMRMWMSDYDLYNEENKKDDDNLSSLNYGSSDPKMPISKVPCGGCGALLHCQDHSIPGYLPKELFANRNVGELRSIICQRCHFLKEFNVALDVSVTPEEYPKIISCIKETRAIAVLIVDLLDFPCSIWPDIMDIIGTERPIILVGNKVDLIPGDQVGYLTHIQDTLKSYAEKMGITRGNIKHVALVSAQTGFGVEDLITRLHSLWDYKSDFFLLGCTNVGKSTLFNTLVQSDFCKTQAVDLVQKATISIWPGTTLNLLKFPVMRPEGWRLAIRQKRLSSDSHMRRAEKTLRQKQFQRNRMYHLPSFMQYVGKTFVQLPDEKLQSKDRVGFDEKDKEFVQGRWCYDTPGVMHPDQIFNIFTTEELMMVIPKEVIVPRFFSLQPGKSLFLGGVGRLDYLGTETNQSTRVAVFSSSLLPVTIVLTEEADEVYNKLLGSKLLAVPCGGPERLAEWPGLQMRDEDLKVKGLGWKECSADIVLSSSGWISVSGGQEMEMTFRVWTPFSRGIHLRQPALLPFSVNFRGKRIHHSPTYHTGRADGKNDEYNHEKN